MEIQNKWIYNKNITINHNLAQQYKISIEKINDTIVSEGGRKTDFKNEVCINLDKIEKILAKKERRNAFRTMDIAFGISKGKAENMVLCEYKLKYKKPANLSKSEIDGKIKYSKNLLGNEPPVLNRFIIIFKSEIKAQSYSILRRLYANKNLFQVLDINELKEKYFKGY